MGSILNENEVQIIELDQIDSYSNKLNFENFTKDKSDLEKLGIKFLVRLSLVPKFDQEKIQFMFKDIVMKNDVKVSSIPALELIIALPSSYPSNQRPLFLNATRLYSN